MRERTSRSPIQPCLALQLGHFGLAWGVHQDHADLFELFDGALAFAAVALPAAWWEGWREGGREGSGCVRF